MDALRIRKVEVSLPKFKVTWGAASLKPQLKALGLKNAFTEDADFGAMSPKEPLLLNDVVHKAFVEVNEEGTEASAASVVGMGLMAGIGPPTPVFRADRPFVFLIIDRATGAITFMGKVTDPS